MKLTTILATHRFLPLFLTQFLGALNDNFFKTALVILVTYQTSTEWHVAPQTLVTLSGALFILPYILFCATAGKLADKYDKAKIARIIKVAEVFFMMIAAIGFYFHLIGFLFLVLFCMGTHSAFFSPVKYALLPDLLHEDELIAGNAYVEGGTFLAILFGTMAGGSYILQQDGEIIVSYAVLVIALLGLLSSQYIPVTTMRNTAVKIHLNLFVETYEIMGDLVGDRELLKSSMANSWFWFVGMTFLTLFPAFTRQILWADEHVVTRFLECFSIGIGVGAFACSQLLHGKVSTHYVRYSAIGMSVFALDLAWASPAVTVHNELLQTLPEFLAHGQGWRMMVDLFMLAFCGGFYIVPLYAILQKQSKPELRAQVMASNNIVNAVFMVLSSVMALVLFEFGFSVVGVFVVTAALNGIVAAFLFTPYGKFKIGEEA